MQSRHLNPKLSLWLNDRAQPYPDTPVKLFVRLALSCVAIKETSPNDGEMIELFQSTIGKAEKEPWCMGFVQSLVAFVEWVFHVTSGLDPSESCAHVFDASKSIRVQNPRVGDLMLYKHRITGGGHVGIIVEIHIDKLGKMSFLTVEGNTSDGTGMNRDGDGVYPKVRPHGDVGNMQLLGFLRPFTWA